MRNHTLYNILFALMALVGFGACAEDALTDTPDTGTGEIITVGAETAGLTTTSTVTTRAAGEVQDAERVNWLIQPLKQGLDITYGKVSDDPDKRKQRVAILKLLGGTESDLVYTTNPTSGYAEYSFKYRGNDGSETEDKARWYDNGPHYFEGVHVPYRLRYKESASELATNNRELWGKTDLGAVTALTTNQSDDTNTGTDNNLGNYTLLAHYLGMPANTQISATVARIKLPFRHRLAHVLAYILIDPALTNGVDAQLTPIPTKIKGYKSTETEQANGKDDPNTSYIRFSNVDVLEGVHDVYNTITNTHTLTPQWKTIRKVVPHFKEEIAEYTVYEGDKATVYPNSSNYTSAANMYDNTENHGGYKKMEYKKVPVYDLIVRPTYTSVDNVMYDEDLTGTTKANFANKVNQIDFEITLDNGLIYEKHFEFDLDANYETVVYLKITREGVDYNESGSELWQETIQNDQWYGVDNQNGHTLSEAGSSWQRAYYNTHLGAGDNITDGGFYDEDTQGEDGTKGQYVHTDTWQEYFLEAYKGGKNHGDYFVLAQDITIDAGTLPSEGLIFTGHLDGFNTRTARGYHTITLTNAGSVVTCDAQKTDVLSKLYTDAAGTVSVPQLYWYKEIAQVKPRRTESISKGKPIEINMNTTRPADLVALDGQGKIILYKDGDEYKVYTNRTFYKKAPAYLFAGLDGVYSTKQEDEEKAGRSIYNVTWQWEANVHKETIYNKDWWIPYKDAATNTGWRAEVMNLTVAGGTLFKEGAEITGYVQNCYEQSDPSDDTTKKHVTDHIPAYPKYK